MRPDRLERIVSVIVIDCDDGQHVVASITDVDVKLAAAFDVITWNCVYPVEYFWSAPTIAYPIVDSSVQVQRDVSRPWVLVFGDGHLDIDLKADASVQIERDDFSVVAWEDDLARHAERGSSIAVLESSLELAIAA